MEDVFGFLATDRGVAIEQVIVLWDQLIREQRTSMAALDFAAQFAPPERTHILSNAWLGERPLIEAALPLERLNRVFISAELGVAKPSAEMWARMCSELGCDPTSLVLIDDREDNVNGARVFGLEAYLWDGQGVVS